MEHSVPAPRAANADMAIPKPNPAPAKTKTSAPRPRHMAPPGWDRFGRTLRIAATMFGPVATVATRLIDEGGACGPEPTTATLSLTIDGNHQSNNSHEEQRSEEGHDAVALLSLWPFVSPGQGINSAELIL